MARSAERGSETAEGPGAVRTAVQTTSIRSPSYSGRPSSSSQKPTASTAHKAGKMCWPTCSVRYQLGLPASPRLPTSRNRRFQARRNVVSVGARRLPSSAAAMGS